MHEQPWEIKVQVFYMNEAKQRDDPKIPALQESNVSVTSIEDSGKKISSC